MQVVEKHRILVADDEDSYRLSVMKHLQLSGLYDADGVGSGEAALEAMNTNHYDLLILDYKMGEVSGLNVLQRMFEQKMILPVIMVTSAGSETIAVEAMKLGAYEYVRKEEFALNRFPDLVRATLERQRFTLEREHGTRSPKKTPEKSEVSEALRSAGVFFSDSANAAIQVLDGELREYRHRISPNLNPSVRTDLDRIFKSVEVQVKVVSLLTEVLTELAALVSGDANTSVRASDSERDFTPVKNTREP